MLLQFEDLSIGYQKKQGPQLVHSNLKGTLQAGQLSCLMGANGAGKSTLLRTLAGLQKPLAGSIWLNERPAEHFSAAQLAQQLSVVLTLPLPGSLKVHELIQLGRQPHTGWLGRPTAADQAAVEKALEATDLNNLSHRRLETLSDGQRQKALIARALAQDGQIMLLDEPTAHLDLPHRLHIMELLHQIAHEQQKAVLVTTHELDLALQTADRLWLLPEPQDAPLVQGLPEDLLLQKAFQQVFSHTRLPFELSSGRFVLPRTARFKVQLKGPEPARYWTEKALLRYGIQATEEQASSVKISIHAAGAAWNWQVDNEQFETLEALLTRLQNRPDC